MKSVMLTLTKGKVRGYLTGLGITMVNQSSSATTVLEAALVGAGLLTFQQSLAVTLGAELGSTFLPQLVAFPSITKFSTIIIAVGFFSSIATKTKKGKHTAMTILGFGLLFMGMDMMSGSLKPLRSYQPFLNLMMKVEAPILGIIVGVLFTMIIQSSGATTGLTIAMAMAGTISLEQAVPIKSWGSSGNMHHSSAWKPCTQLGGKKVCLYTYNVSADRCCLDIHTSYNSLSGGKTLYLSCKTLLS